MKNLRFSTIAAFLIFSAFTIHVAHAFDISANSVADFERVSPSSDSECISAPVLVAPTVQLKEEYCGITDFTTNDIIKSTQPANTAGIIYYQWRFTELEAPFNVYEHITNNPTNPNFRLSFFGEIAYGRSYDVSIRIAQGPVFDLGAYGPSCTIQLQPTVLTTKLEQQYASGFFDYCDVIGADDVGAADKYRWTFDNFEDPLFEVYGDGDERLLRISKAGLTLGKTYIVRVYATVNGTESPVGAGRFISTNNAVPNTGLRTDIYTCGGSYPLNTQVQAIEICKAETYTWRFRNTSQTQADLIYTRTDGNRFIRLEWVTGLIPGNNYDVDVKARQGAKNGDYSSVCNITITASTAGLVADVYAIYESDNGGINTAEEDGDVVGFYREIPNSESEIETAPLEINLINNGGQSDNGISFNVVYAADTENQTRFELYDLNGRLIAQKTDFIVGEGNTISWNIPGFAPGIYVLKAINGQNSVTKKVSVF